MAVRVRYVSSDWTISWHLVCALLVTKSMTREEVARKLTGTISGNLLATMRNKCTLNSVAMKVVYPHVLDVGCFCHTPKSTGKKFKTPTLEEFTKLWISLFTHSHKARIVWKSTTGTLIHTCSDTLWWS